jgi:hypothetical protein
MELLHAAELIPLAVVRGAVDCAMAASLSDTFQKAPLLSVSFPGRGGLLVSTGNLLQEGNLNLSLLPIGQTAAGLMFHKHSMLHVGCSARSKCVTARR